MTCLSLYGCLSEDYEDCETEPAIDFSLKFIYDYNEQGIDLFEKEVEYIDVFLFDENAAFLRKLEVYVSGLTENRLPLDLGEGTYTAVIWGNTHVPEFYLPDVHDLESINQLHLTLETQDNEVDTELPILFHGKSTFTIKKEEEKQVCIIHLSRNTKIIRFVFSGIEHAFSSLYEVNQQVVITATNGEYSYDNTTDDSERTIVYMPISETPNTRNHDLLVTFNTLQINENTDLRIKLWDTRMEFRPMLETNLLPYLLKDIEPEDVSEYLQKTHEFTLELGIQEVDGGYVVTRIVPVNWSDIHENWNSIHTPGEI